MTRPPTLLLINGPPASGKSTVARRLAERRPGTAIVDIDALRSAVPGRRTDPSAANLLSREQADAAVTAALADGLDVVVPQLMARHEFADRLERCTDEVGARWCEVQLMIDADLMIERFVARSAAAERPEHVYAAWQLEQEGGPESLRAWVFRLEAYRAERVGAGRVSTTIDTAGRTPDQVADAVISVLDE